MWISSERFEFWDRSGMLGRELHLELVQAPAHSMWACAGHSICLSLSYHICKWGPWLLLCANESALMSSTKCRPEGILHFYLCHLFPSILQVFKSSLFSKLAFLWRRKGRGSRCWRIVMVRGTNKWRNKRESYYNPHLIFIMNIIEKTPSAVSGKFSSPGH